MPGDTANARIWGSAEVFAAPVGSTPPTDTTSPLDAAWKSLGLLGEDGITFGSEAESTDHFEYAGGLVRNTRGQFKKTLAFFALEDTPEVFTLANPGSTASTDAGVTTRTVNVPTVNEQSFILETKDGAINRRIVIARGEVTEVGDQTISSDELAAREMTIDMYIDNGAFYVEITDDPQADVGP